MHILFLGHSNLVKRRLLPILPLLPELTRVSLARFRRSDEAIPAGVHEIYNGFDEAERHCAPDLVYVSTVNSAHFDGASRWLARGCHVIVDKPATLRLQDTESLLALAARRKVLVAEATVYTYHPQVALLRSLFGSHAPRQATAQFAFPPLEPGNFRYRADLGGGAVFDTAAYAASVGRVFFGTLPSSVATARSEHTADGLCLSYSTLMQYPDGQTMVGHFGFNSEYINRLHLLGEHSAVQMDRVFTTPADLANPIHVQRQNEHLTVHAEPANAFTFFFRAVFRALKQSAYETFANDMVYDATVTHQLQQQLCKGEGR
jgi:predicted dehydrogenase